MAVAEEIERLKALRDAGTLSEAEFEEAKAKALRPGPSAPAGSTSGRGTRWAIWTLVIMVAGAAAAALYFLDSMSRSLELIAGGVGVVAAAAGAVMSVTEDLSITGLVGFIVIGLAIGAVAFAAMAPVLLLAALIIFPVVIIWGWIGESFTG